MIAAHMSAIHITDIEAAINFWREKSPAGDGFSLAAPTRALAEVYALLMVQQREYGEEESWPLAARDAWRTWYESTPDTPCIAICSTSQGDDWCKGCGRSFAEVQHWTDMSPAQKRLTWRRITLANTAWRFNRYAERAAEGKTS
jgi:predicted Fe-S protein YdhL (DUF1289 family)